MLVTNPSGLKAIAKVLLALYFSAL